jgi:DNA-binding XRE family transcriptional regulator
MGHIIRLPRHARVSSSLSAANSAKVFKLIPRFPSEAARAATPTQCGAGMPRERQPLTVDMDCSSAPATAAVPPKSEMIVSQDVMAATIVRALRTRQGFATCETTFFCGRGQIDPMEMDSDEAVGRRIVALREKAGLQQQELAAQIHITKSTLSAYESGSRPLTMESARRLRRRFGVPIDWILFGDMQAAGQGMMLAIGPEPGAVIEKKVRSLRK